MSAVANAWAMAHTADIMSLVIACSMMTIGFMAIPSSHPERERRHTGGQARESRSPRQLSEMSTMSLP